MFNTQLGKKRRVETVCCQKSITFIGIPKEA